MIGKMTREEAKEFLIFISHTLGHMDIEYLTAKDGEKMREAIKALEQEPKWIPVSKRLPKEGKEVLVSGYDTYNKRVIISRYQDEQYGFTCGLASAWMPLPKPFDPQKDKEKEE